MTYHAALRPSVGRSHVRAPAYARMLRRVFTRRATAAEMIAVLNRPATNTMRHIVTRMWQAGLIHVVAWVKAPSGRGKLVPQFRFGAGDDAPYPGVAGYQFGNHAALAPMIEMVAFARFIGELEAPRSAWQLVEATGWSRGTVLRLIQLCRELRLIRLCHYERRQGIGGEPTPYYELNREQLPDAERIAPKTHAQVGADYRARQRGPMALMARQLQDAANQPAELAAA